MPLRAAAAAIISQTGSQAALKARCHFGWIVKANTEVTAMYSAPLRNCVSYSMNCCIRGVDPISRAHRLFERYRRIDSRRGRPVAQTVLTPSTGRATSKARVGPEGVVTAPGFRDAYRQFAQGGWSQLELIQRMAGRPYAGAGHRGPGNLGIAISHSSSVRCYARCRARPRAVWVEGAEQKFLPKMVSGNDRTMVLHRAPGRLGLAQIRTRAVPEGDHYRLFGQKIFITWGDHDCTIKSFTWCWAHRRRPCRVRDFRCSSYPR